MLKFLEKKFKNSLFPRITIQMAFYIERRYGVLDGLKLLPSFCDAKLYANPVRARAFRNQHIRQIKRNEDLESCAACFNGPSGQFEYFNDNHCFELLISLNARTSQIGNCTEAITSGGQYADFKKISAQFQTEDPWKCNLNRGWSHRCRWRAFHRQLPSNKLSLFSIKKLFSLSAVHSKTT